MQSELHLRRRSVASCTVSPTQGRWQFANYNWQHMSNSSNDNNNHNKQHATPPAAEHGHPHHHTGVRPTLKSNTYKLIV